ncbi:MULTISPECIES: hypothetical protein [Lysobacter]|uniref:hypothetical protein n=1 Tax=Lysobacter TaxID=68 RepID=UPI001F303EEC|nr:MULTISPECIES: hypothetical protein [Lysobacter]UJB19019.1 hypothetical protein L1A79_22340 [Lysobacter capsici]UJQ27256.1 hypothetical protein L2D09_17545 [Lysobacter gummosus]
MATSSTPAGDAVARADRPRPNTRVRLWLALGALALLAGLAGAAVHSARQHRDLERSARIHAQVAALFESRLGVDAICHLERAPFASIAWLIDTEVQLRRLASSEQALTLACGLSVLARSHALIGRYAQAERLSGEANGLLDRHGLENLSVTATTVSLMNLQARYAPAEKIAKAELRRGHDGIDMATRLDQLRLQLELSRAQWGLADDDGAMSSLEDALAQARVLVPPNAGLIAELLSQRGEWRGRRFDFSGAEHDLTQAIAMSQGTTQADNARYQLVRMLSYSEQPERAIAEAGQLVADRQAHLGAQHPDTGRAWIAQSDAQYNAGHISDSIGALQHGKAIVLASYGARHPEYAEVLRLESLHDYMHMRYDSSVGKAREAVKICEQAFGPTHEQTLRVRFNLATKLTFGLDSRWDSPDYREGLGMLEDLVQTGSETDIPMPYEKMTVGIALAMRAPEHELPRAERILREVQVDIHQYLPARAAARSYVDFTLASVMYRDGRQVQADEQFARFVQARDGEQSLPLPTRTLIHEALMYRALYAMSTCRREDALTALRKALKSDREHLSQARIYARQAQDYLGEIERHGVLSEHFGRKQVADKRLDGADAKLYFQASRLSLDCSRGLLAKR